MNSKLKYLTAFLVGVVAGGAAAWRFAKDKYERIAEEEILSVKNVYSRRETTAVQAVEDGETTEASAEPAQQPVESVVDYAARLRGMGYSTGEETGEKEAGAMLYIISPDAFGENDDYDKISLTYYIDGTLANENDEAFDDADDIFGLNFFEHFGEYEDDSVFVRNDRLRCDYEILLDRRTYQEVFSSKPYLRREE